MVRTKADNCGRKAVASKAPRKNFNAGGSSSSSFSSNGDSFSAGGCNLINHAKMWPTPKWQKGIDTFFQKKEKVANESTESSSAGSSVSSSPKKSERDKETEEVLVIDKAVQESDKENSATESASEERNTKDKPVKSGKQKASVLGKTVAGSSNKKKRRVVLADDSDDE